MIGELEEAVRYMCAAISVCPAHAEALINRGRAYLMMGRQEEGLRDYEAASFYSGGDKEVDAILKQHGRKPWKC